MAQKFKWYEFGKITDINDLNEYLDGKEFSHSSYSHYTSLKNIDSILKSKTFYLSSVAKFNDKLDSKQFVNENKFYSLCFSTGVNENLALWYLYAGLDGCGGRITFTAKQIQKLIENAQFSLQEVDDGQPIGISLDLQKNHTVKIQVKDVIYFKEKKQSVDLKYNTQTNYNISKSDWEEFALKYKSFLKGLIWYYEKETRIIAELTGSILKKLEKNKEYVIKMTIDDKIFKQMKIKLAPEITEETEDKVLSEYFYINKFMKKTSNISLSDNSGTIEMKLKDNLCKNCKK